jgi:hypothetical protein
MTCMLPSGELREYVSIMVYRLSYSPFLDQQITQGTSEPNRPSLRDGALLFPYGSLLQERIAVEYSANGGLQCRSFGGDDPSDRNQCHKH